MENKQIETIENVFCDVFENMAFMFGEMVAKKELSENHSNHLKAHMTYSGSKTGEVILTVPEEMCPEIAANVLGVASDDDQVQEMARDALKELLNIVCGQILTELEGTEPVFNLSVPEIYSISANEWKELLAAKQSLGFIVDEYPVILSVNINSEK